MLALPPVNSNVSIDMSYFMIVAGSTAAIIGSEAELIPASDAQSYISELEGRISEFDGGPVFLVHDKETSTSDVLVMDLKEALRSGDDYVSVPLFGILSRCFKQGVSFRIWLAGNDKDDIVSNSEEVNDLESAIEALRDRRGVWWHVKQQRAC